MGDPGERRQGYHTHGQRPAQRQIRLTFVMRIHRQFWGILDFAMVVAARTNLHINFKEGVQYIDILLGQVFVAEWLNLLDCVIWTNSRRA